MRRQGNHSNHSDDYPDGQTGAMSQAVKIDTARRYLARGWSLLPLRSHDKRPLVAWEPLACPLDQPIETIRREWVADSHTGGGPVHSINSRSLLFLDAI